MMRLLFFVSLAFWCVVALVPLRMAAWKEPRAGHTVNAITKYLETLKALRALDGIDYSDDRKVKAALDYGRALVMMRRFLDAESIYVKVISARKKRKGDGRQYDRFLADALMTQGHGRIAMGDARSALVSFEELMNYNRSLLPQDDPRLIRDLNNTGVATLLSARGTPDPNVRATRLKKALEYFDSALAKQRKAAGNGSIAEANMLENIANTMEDLDMTAEADENIKAARKITARLERPCTEP